LYVGKPQSKLLGKTQPRLWTPPLRPLTRRTSLGYAFIDFCQAAGRPLIAYQRWLAVHSLELNPDGTLRYRVVIVLIARQNGKTEYARLLSLFKLYVLGVRLVLGVAQGIGLARENLNGSLELAQSSPWLAGDIADIRRANGDESFTVAAPVTYRDVEGDESMTLASGSRYKICAANRRAGRGLTVDHLSADEIREWRSDDAWSALSKTTNARINGQTWCYTNQGDDQSVTLLRLRDAALSRAEETIALFEWSGEDGCDLDDWQQIRQANPALGILVSPAAIRTAMVSDSEETYRTEILCQKVDALDAAVSYRAWQESATPSITLDTPELRKRLAVCFDISPDGRHASLAAAARLPGGEAAVEIAGAWRSADEARTELPGLLARLEPRAIAWYPTGPGGAFADVLRPAIAPRWNPAYIELTGGRQSEVCMEFSSLVSSGRICHPGDELLTAQVRGASKIRSADGWRFGRRGEAHCDCVYGAAGAAAAALALPEPAVARIRVLSY
jgi:hypothetical protein